MHIVRSNTHNVHSSVTPSAAQQLNRRLDYVKTLLQTLDGIYVNQPKRFLPLAKEAKKLAEEFRKEEIASQWAGIPHEKLLQESCGTTQLPPKFRLSSPSHGSKRTFT